jgi:hypothetical protein
MTSHPKRPRDPSRYFGQLCASRGVSLRTKHFSMLSALNYRELSTYFVAGTDNSPDYLSKPSMKLVRLIFSPAEMKERQPILPVD